MALKVGQRIQWKRGHRHTYEIVRTDGIIVYEMRTVKFGDGYNRGGDTIGETIIRISGFSSKENLFDIVSSPVQRNIPWL